MNNKSKYKLSALISMFFLLISSHVAFASESEEAKTNNGDLDINNTTEDLRQDVSEKEKMQSEKSVEYPIESKDENKKSITNKSSDNSKSDSVSSIGLEAEFIITLKRNLSKLGFGDFSDSPSSNYDTETSNAVRDFQQYYGLKESGEVDEDTERKIEEIMQTPFQLGESDPDIIQLKKNLNHLGFHVSSNPTELFGSMTEQKVKEFQVEYKLVANGIADDVTLNKLTELIDVSEEKLLEKGMRHADVVVLKQNLKQLGFTVPGNGTNLYGTQTERKVKEFQQYFGLEVTGKAGELTLNKIDEILDSPFRLNKRHGDTIQLKKNLNLLGFHVSNNPTDLYGSLTEQKVKEFQEQYNLVVNGIADEVTLNKIEKLIEKPLEKGMRRGDVVILKQNLKQLGFTVPGNGTNLYGTQTERKVKEFQQYFGLEVTGKAGKLTFNKIDEILETPFQLGKRHVDTIQLKKNLNLLGIHVSNNPTDLYGSMTKQKVKEFQGQYNLVVNGIADEVTLKKIKELIEKPLKKGQRRGDVVELKQNLERLGFAVPGNGTNLYGTQTERKVKEFQEYYGFKITGVVDRKTKDRISSIINSPLQKGKRHEDTIQLKIDLEFLGMSVPGNGTDLFGIQTERKIKEFQAKYNLVVNGIADEVTLKKIKELIEKPLEKGMRRGDVVVLKQDLEQLGFTVPGNGTNLYGTQTERKVKEFQEYYSLKITGIVDQVTEDKLKSIINSPFQKGYRDPFTVQLKENLNKLGFHVSGDLTDYYDSKTEKNIKDLQRYYNLVINGIADEVTIEKIESILNSPFQNGKRSPKTIKLKKDLEKVGFYISHNPTDLYGSKTEKVVREFQEYYGLAVNGIADEITLAKIDELLKSNTYTHYNLSLDEAIEIQMNQKAQTDQNNYAWVSKSYIDSNGRVTASALNVRTQPTTKDQENNWVLGTLSKGTRVDIIDEKGNWYAIKYNNNAWVHAVRKDIRYYLDPNNFMNDARQRFQFLDLSKPSGAPRSVLDNYLNDKGVLKGQGQAFIDAAITHGINEVYLLSHALLETGHGTSTLAKGVRVGINSDGEPERVKNSNRNSLKNIKTVYNVYGIGAVDSNPLNGGSTYAYSQGWFSVRDAIIGGAAFIGGGYIKVGQNTLYKMRWNPLMNDGMAWKQYATDIGWASKQVHTMYNLYNEIGFNSPILDIPVFK